MRRITESGAIHGIELTEERWTVPLLPLVPFWRCPWEFWALAAIPSRLQAPRQLRRRRFWRNCSEYRPRSGAARQEPRRPLPCNWPSRRRCRKDWLVPAMEPPIFRRKWCRAPCHRAKPSRTPPSQRNQAHSAVRPAMAPRRIRKRKRPVRQRGSSCPAAGLILKRPPERTRRQQRSRFTTVECRCVSRDQAARSV
jgi:hypothetical protein